MLFHTGNKGNYLLAIFFSFFLIYLLKPDQSEAAPNEPIIFITQTPILSDFANIGTTFSNHSGSASKAPRGGHLYIRYPDGTLKNLTQSAGYGNDIAVRDPNVHWDGNKAIFSMVIGNVQLFQMYEVTGFGKNDTPVITLVADQPFNYNNITPIYDSLDNIIFTSDKPFRGLDHLYPQLDEYESTATNTGIWILKTNGQVVMLDHSPSGNFTPIIDSFGRVLFTKWDHLQRDQQQNYPNVHTFDDESVNSLFTYVSDIKANGDLHGGEVFPESLVFFQNN